MSAQTRLVIVDDHPVFRRGLREIIESDRKFVVVGEAGDGAAALACIAEKVPEVAVVDLGLPGMDGLDLLRALCRLPVAPAVVVLTMQSDEASLNAAMDAGARGYILKENAVTDVQVGLKAVAGGGIFISPSMAHFLVRRRRRASALREEKRGLQALTPTERRVVLLVAENKTNKEIGQDLFISHRTVETHRRNICEKLELTGSRALLKFAFEHRSEL